MAMKPETKAHIRAQEKIFAANVDAVDRLSFMLADALESGSDTARREFEAALAASPWSIHDVIDGLTVVLVGRPSRPHRAHIKGHTGTKAEADELARLRKLTRSAFASGATNEASAAWRKLRSAMAASRRTGGDVALGRPCRVVEPKPTDTKSTVPPEKPAGTKSTVPKPEPKPEPKPAGTKSTVPPAGKPTPKPAGTKSTVPPPDEARAAAWRDLKAALAANTDAAATGLFLKARRTLVQSGLSADDLAKPCGTWGGARPGAGAPRNETIARIMEMEGVSRRTAYRRAATKRR